MAWQTVGQVAKQYGRTNRQVLATIERGTLPANRPDGCKEYRIASEDAERVFGLTTVHAPLPKADRESESARIARQLANAGVST